MRTFLGALWLGAGTSAIAVLLALSGGTLEGQLMTSEAADTVCEAISRDCAAAPVLALTGSAMVTADGAADEPVAVPRARHIFIDHAYPDHP